MSSTQPHQRTAHLHAPSPFSYSCFSNSTKSLTLTLALTLALALALALTLTTLALQVLVKFYEKFVEGKKSEYIDDDGNVIKTPGAQYEDNGTRKLY